MRKKKSKSSLFNSMTFDSLEGLFKFDLSDVSFELENSRSKLYSKNKLFLHTFSHDNMLSIIKETGLLKHLEKIGLDDIIVVIDLDDEGIDYFKIFWKKVKPECNLLDLRLSEKKFIPSSKFFDPPSDTIVYDMIVIEWMSSQNPLSEFTRDMPQLPGQIKPGLGILKYCFKIMEVIARNTTRDGFLDIPDHFHGAVMYSKRFKFFNPAQEGILRALLRDLKHCSLSDISWGMITGSIIDKYSQQPEPFAPAEQVFYVSERLRQYFHSPKYKEIYKKYYKQKKFYLDYDAMVLRKEEMLKNSDIIDL